jgi:hypothetical protein
MSFVCSLAIINAISGVPMLQQFQTIITETPNKAIALSGALIACFSLVPPTLMFTCKYVTQSCRQSKNMLTDEDESDTTKRIKMD